MERSVARTRDELLLRATAEAASPLPRPRLLLVLAHPDDEVLAMGARLERLGESRLLTLTDGAPDDGGDATDHGFASLEQYREARRGELQAAIALAGLPATWAQPFPEAVPDQQAGFHLLRLTRALLRVVNEFRPEAIVTHPYEGGHPDHDACAFAVHAAVQLAGEQCPILEAPFYHAGPSGAMETGCFLPGTDQRSVLTCVLSATERQKKAARLACFASQAQTLAQFTVDQECFRPAPAYDFTQRPHPGTLFYEQFPWGMHGDRFCSLAAEAQNELFGPVTGHTGTGEGHPAAVVL